MAQSGRKPFVVLIVEDEFLIRMDAVDMIRDAGFDVVEAGDADAAILILESRFDITIVFTDIQMPGSMDGLKLRPPFEVGGRRSRLWPPPACFTLAKMICRLAASFYPNLTVPDRLSARSAN